VKGGAINRERGERTLAQPVARLARQPAIYLEYSNASREPRNVYGRNRTGDRRQRLYNLFLGEEHLWGASGFGAKHFADPVLAQLRFAHYVDGLEKYVPLPGCRRMEKQGDPQARGPELPLAKEDAAQFHETHFTHGNGRIDDDRHIAARGISRRGRKQRHSEQDQN
jgi:hypothetical protein